MKHDITPYSPEEAIPLGKALSQFGVRSLGPQVCVNLLEVVKDLSSLLSTRKDLTDDMRAVIEGYRSRLMDICEVEAGMQNQVLKQLKSLLGT